MAICFVFLPSNSIFAQQVIEIHGKVSSSDNQPIAFASVSVKGTSIGALTNERGEYKIIIPANRDLTIVFSHLGYQLIEKNINSRNFSAGEKLNVVLQEDLTSLEEVEVFGQSENQANLVRIEMKDFDYIPNTSGSFEAILKTVGVSSRNELSSQYSVRGGNYDENLVYVNDIEIYRPLLIRSGQQEGLSFINSDMVSSVQFSAGGFDAMYGDKLSSVLDIKYHRPTEFGGTAYASLLGAGLHFEGLSRNKRFTHNSGFRYRTNKYLLNSLETEGDYNPEFLDFQSFLTYDLGKKSELSFLGHVSQNKYNFAPGETNTTFGTLQQALALRIFYEGQEIDRFLTYTGALSYQYQPKSNLNLKLIASGYNSNEQENFDILGQYLINALDNNIGSETAGDSILNIGVGTSLEHARNTLHAQVYSFEHKGSFYTSKNHFRWGIRYAREIIDDEVHEWEMIDSADFSVPLNREKLELFDSRYGDNRIETGRLTGFFQNTFGIPNIYGEMYITAGLRASYWDLNNQLLLSPRGSMTFQPDWDIDMMFRLAAGIYYQPPFYKELRNVEAQLVTNVKAQKSVHYVAGLDYYFQAWGRSFKLSSELYYKQLSNLVPYKLDNLRIQYYPELEARGYATGFELKLNGEFVENSESWISLSMMRTQEDILGDYYFENRIVKRFTPFEDKFYYELERYKYTPGYYPRPTDQFFNINVFFQDYFPFNPDYKVHLNAVFGSRMRTNNPNIERFDIVYGIKGYKRVDLGFSKSLIKNEIQSGFFSGVKSLWLSGEIFNMFGIKNIVSYQWIRTVSNQDGVPEIYAVPNNLTGRRFNVKLTMKF